ncbi:copper resistance protein CopC, partial [Micromonospora sp. NPDC002296]|uniref:copper resistance CopC family protein n=1 Tax=Micromonospora sp. NPDC002296 TaxID=3154271 RepID=UPI00332EA4EC
GARGAEGGRGPAPPPAGGVAAAAPAEVTLDFDAGVDAGESHVAVLDVESRTVTDGEPTKAGSTRLRLPVSIGAAGDYTIAYHVTFTDGSTATGAHRFSVGTGVAPAPLDDAARQAGVDVVVEHGHGIDGFSAFLLVIDGAVLAVALALLWLRPRGGRAASLRLDPRT